jgi:hypothetical protein
VCSTDEVNALAIRQLADLFRPVGVCVIDRFVGAELARECEFFVESSPW